MMTDSIGSLTEREKETLRLLLAGHDAKSVAIELGLSVYTVNDRLREARRKLGVSSSKAAARLLASHEVAAPPEKLAPQEIGSAPTPDRSDKHASPSTSRGWHSRWLIGGSLMLAIIVAAALAITATPQSDLDHNSAAEQADDWTGEWPARNWLTWLDAGEYDRAIKGSGAAMRTAMPPAKLAETLASARAPLGQFKKRKIIASAVTAPDREAADGGQMIFEFESDFAKRNNAIERVVLTKEGGRWKVIGYFIR
jgi:DNA-binding CsgD family transcriptional regulator